MSIKVMLLDPNVADGGRIGDWMRSEGWHVITERTVSMARHLIGKTLLSESCPFDVAIINWSIGSRPGSDLITYLREQFPEIQILVLKAPLHPEPPAGIGVLETPVTSEHLFMKRVREVTGLA